jgi:hypothetical protein
MTIFLAASLIDNLGNYRWFRPYDHQVSGAALLCGLLWYILFGEQVKAWVKEAQEKRDREDEIQ